MSRLRRLPPHPLPGLPARVGVLALAGLLLVACSSPGSPRSTQLPTRTAASSVASGSVSSLAAPATSSAGRPKPSSTGKLATPAPSVPKPAISPTGSAKPSPHKPKPPAGSVPRFDHVVVVVEENRSYSDVIGRSSAPYLNSLAAGGALFSRSFAITHPSEPNYLALFSGSTHGVTDDSCPHSYAAANLGSQLLGAGLSFRGYSESLPSTGFTGCGSGGYARKHNPWVNFAGSVPAADNLPLGAFPADYNSLPTVSFVVPNLNNDMHDGSVASGDSWLRAHLGGYAQWARTHNSLLIVTWDEDDRSAGNQIPTIFYGQWVRAGRYAGRINHYNVLRTLEQAYGLPGIGNSAAAAPITNAW